MGRLGNVVGEIYGRLAGADDWRHTGVMAILSRSSVFTNWDWKITGACAQLGFGDQSVLRDMDDEWEDE